ncbi:transposase [Streptomyces sp. PSKA54]|uniref:Transposase n=1 Tax=Streptomyces himalayensis subsp. aureolus TaxID=2758039 RepID=A0A7W2HJV6_9ACTN|nr:integrase core domain-containing protein [Streptomyces himalayensis]MBA4866522.1 transposase [Streptomyces himalayensis subsp. aureolus]
MPQHHTIERSQAGQKITYRTLKSEIGTTVWQTRMQARRDVFGWIAQYYNRERLHSTIGYPTPHQARTRYRQRLDLAV